MGRLFGAYDILIRGKHINFVTTSSREDFLWGRHFNATPARPTYNDKAMTTAAVTRRQR